MELWILWDTIPHLIIVIFVSHGHDSLTPAIWLCRHLYSMQLLPNTYQKQSSRKSLQRQQDTVRWICWNGFSRRRSLLTWPQSGWMQSPTTIDTFSEIKVWTVCSIGWTHRQGSTMGFVMRFPVLQHKQTIFWAIHTTLYTIHNTYTPMSSILDNAGPLDHIAWWHMCSPGWQGNQQCIVY